MRVFAHPFHVAPDGAVVTVEQWSDAQARQLVQSVVSTVVGERAMAPAFGVSDPTGRGVDAEEVWAAVELCEPDLRITDVTVPPPTAGTQRPLVSAVWRDNDDDGGL